jgi:uncharacterized protein YecA (UPF0149 family)
MWCKQCQDYTLFNTPIQIGKSSEPQCRVCQKEFEEHYLSEVPEAKIMEQRERYKLSERQSKELSSYLKILQASNNHFSQEWEKPTIYETDAGQKRIDAIEYNKKVEKHNALVDARNKLREEAIKYNKLGRNDTCLCGTGLKFKKCCLGKYRDFI